MAGGVQGACMVGGMHGGGECGGATACGEEGACMVGVMHDGGMCGGCVCAGGHVWQGACMAGVYMVGACVTEWGVHGRGRAWQERRPLQRAVCILLECILVAITNSLRDRNLGLSSFTRSFNVTIL